MPEMWFDIEWPDGTRDSCYSPSLIIKDYFEPGQAYALAEFLNLSRAALTIASDRVKAKYGFACSRALGQLAKIEAVTARFSEAGGEVSVVSFHDL